MFNIFKPKINMHYDLSWLAVDMHSHLIPGIDDGCADTAMSLKCIAGMQELGLKHFIATPHIFSEVYPNSRSSIEPALQRLNEALRVHGGFGDLQVEAAAEYMLDDAFQGYFGADQAMPMILPGRQILIEMSYQFERKDVLDQIFHLQLQDFTPILAHPERYLFYHQDRKAYARMKDRGCKFQLNLLSLSGYYGEQVRKTANYLIKEHMIDYIGTDLHHPKHLAALRQFVGSNDVRKMLKGNHILNETLLT